MILVLAIQHPRNADARPYIASVYLVLTLCCTVYLGQGTVGAM